MSSPEAVYDAIRETTSEVVVGNEDVLEGLTVALLTDGHVLLEGVPGVAKTTIANAFARALGLSYGRIQMTPDMVPADVSGTNVYRQATGEFQLRKGPVFSNLVVADEINRATPKTQSALLEAMEESTVTIEGETLQLPRPFMVVATQNPIEMEGVFELPEAQRDRFQLKYTVDVPDRADEREVLDRFDDSPSLDADEVEQVVETEDVLAASDAVTDVFVADPVKEYILDLVAATRDSPALRYGGSPRATLAFLRGSKARAAIRGRSYVIPDDVKALAEPVLVHRVIRTTDAELADRGVSEIIREIVDGVVPPGADVSFAEAEMSEGETTETGDGTEPKTGRTADGAEAETGSDEPVFSKE
ncbi:AAA domain-containing protein [Halorubrum sp. CBA1125]|uniref:AAA family ATPase n=1 Tax=Halorubrum sp. CBA1125 TaxID=2668072 RepID=UPI0012E93348|nr:MoxR family ATPase [Halorubrum sp. CBA1125]MUW14935.1 AAA domain-containing protein [Halorubrum sp. CBA1125]